MISASTICTLLLENEPGTQPDDAQAKAKALLVSTADLKPRLAAALNLYNQRKARNVHPNGSFDKQGRWYPSASERQTCCDGIRSPSVSFPYSLMLHCRTLDHVAHLHGVSPELLRRYARGKF